MVLSRSQIAEYEEIITQAFKKESFLASISESIVAVVTKQLEKHLEGMITKYEDSINKCNEQISALKVENQALQNDLNNKIDTLEQYSRRNNIRIYGIQETAEENVEEITADFLRNKLNMKVGENYFERCHRVGPKQANKSRPILVKFLTYKFKADVYRSKSKLKGSKFLIKEDLTGRRVTCLKTLIGKYGYRKVWTSDGNIMYNNGTSTHKFTF